jgi:hypothetical protein
MPMRRALFGYASGMLAAALIAAGTLPSAAKITITPAERCSRLARQVDEAIKANAANKQVVAASTLQKKAIRFCAQKKRAQGIRYFAKALKLLGARPVDID